ncbi:MAG: hypothetical protein E3K32_03945 [wastewater metagenome]|nr:hypothetical protein [Candidatus Loosdrechtia aerotolerans]
MIQQFTQPEIIIIRAAWPFSWWGEGLCEYLRSKGRKVMELGPIEESPEKRATRWNIETYLSDWSPDSVRKLVVFFGHGSTLSVMDTDEKETITKYNHRTLTKDLHVFMFSCFTGYPCSNEDIQDEDYLATCTEYGLGREAVERGGCCSWYGFTDFIQADKRVLSADNSVVYSKIRRGLWAYVDALVAGKTVEEAEDSLVKGLLKARDEIDALREDFDITKEDWEIIQEIKKKTIDEYLLQGRLYKRGNGLRLDSCCRPLTTKRDGPVEIWKGRQMLMFLKGWWANRLGTGVRFTEPTSWVKISDGRVINVPGNETSVDIVFRDPGTYTWALESEVRLYDALGRPGRVERQTVEHGLLKVVVAPKEVPDVITPPSGRARPALIQSDFGTSSNFEVVLWETASLRHYWRDNDLPNLPWRQGPLFGDHVASAPALIQSSFGAPHGNFEVVVREGMQLHHYWRDNNAPNLPWWPGGLFGKTIQSAASLIQARLGGTGNNFHVAAIEFIAGEYLAYGFCRDTSQDGDGSWVRTQPIGMVGKWIVSSRPVGVP